MIVRVKWPLQLISTPWVTSASPHPGISFVRSLRPKQWKSGSSDVVKKCTFYVQSEKDLRTICNPYFRFWRMVPLQFWNPKNCVVVTSTQHKIHVINVRKKCQRMLYKNLSHILQLVKLLLITLGFLSPGYQFLELDLGWIT